VLNRPLPTIYFIRHGETDWNKQGLVQGSIETDLNAHGIEQAKAVAAALAQKREELFGFQFVVSPQQRAQQTMSYVTSALDISMANVKIEPRVCELGFGIWEGKPFWELKASPIFPADAETRYDWRPEGGESYADGVARVDDWLKEVSLPTVVVAHGAVGRCLMGYVSGLSPADLVALKTPQGCYCRLQNGQIDWFDANHNAA
jgi:broad specificity phosphatase PhoE